MSGTTIRTDVVREAQKTQGEATARPEIAPRLSLVVLPFVNLNNDPTQDYFADAITTDLTTDLVRTPAIFVVGRETAFTYKNKSIDLKQFGTDLGIRWAVQGAVRRNGDQVRVNIWLTVFRLPATSGQIGSTATVQIWPVLQDTSQRGFSASHTCTNANMTSHRTV